MIRPWPLIMQTKINYCQIATRLDLSYLASQINALSNELKKSDQTAYIDLIQPL